MLIYGSPAACYNAISRDLPEKRMVMNLIE